MNHPLRMPSPSDNILHTLTREHPLDHTNPLNQPHMPHNTLQKNMLHSPPEP